MTSAEMRDMAVKLAMSRLMKNSYTQGADRGYVFGKPEGAERGYSDCSSFVNAVLKRVLGYSIGSNTDAQIANRAKGVVIEDNRDGKRSYPTLNKLQPGDCIYYKGNASHIWQVGHVEMAVSQDQCIGHGSGTGPTLKNTKRYSQNRTGARKYLCVIRWIPDEPRPVVDGDEEVYPAPVDNTGKLRATGSVNIRKGPSTSFGIVKTVGAGTVLTPIEPAGWRPVIINDVVRWVSEKYVEQL